MTEGISLATQEDTVRDAIAQQAADDLYAGDVVTLTAVFRSQFPCSDPKRFPSVLRSLALLLMDGWSAADAQFPQQVLEDHGPGAILLALKRAYDQPAHVVSDVVEHE